MADLAIIILTFNEECHLARALNSVESIASEIFVIDSYSFDRTVEIAHARGATVLENKFVNYAKQFQWALENAPITASWVMRLDADEIVGPNLASEIDRKLPTLGGDIAGVNLKRKHIFMGQWIRHGGRYPLVLLRIWRNGQGRIESRWMDEHMIVWGGRTVTFCGDFADHNLNGLTFFTDKHNKYATREAIDILNQKYGLFSRDEDLSSKSASLQAAVKRWLKEKIYNRLPFWVGPLGYFLYRYIMQFGFLDGSKGLVYHFLQGFWYRFLVGAKVAEYDAVLSTCATLEDRRLALERLTGYSLVSAPKSGV